MTGDILKNPGFESSVGTGFEQAAKAKWRHACMPARFVLILSYILRIYNGFSGFVILSSTERNKYFFNTGKTLPKEACQHFYSWIFWHKADIFLATLAIKGSGIWRNSAIDISFIFIVNVTKCC